MSLLSYDQLVILIAQGVIDAPIENVNAASIDLTLDDEIMFESSYQESTHPVDLSKRESIHLERHLMSEDGYVISPGAFILASTREVFNLPKFISCEYKLKSSMARNALEHCNAGWADAGFNNSKLTLELKNFSQYQSLRIRPGMPIGQMVFFLHSLVPDHASYANKGRYNGQQSVTASKGIV